MAVQLGRGRPRLKPLGEKGARIVPGESLHGAVVSQLRSMIQEGELAPGEQIVESALSETFGVSRTPMREALKVLSSEGLVELRPRRTPVVAALDTDEIAAIFEVMEGLEAIAGRRAKENASAADIEELNRMHTEMVEQHDRGNRVEYAAINRAIHAKIVDLSRNSVLKVTYANFSVRIHRARSTTNYDAGRWVESIREHEQIMDALHTGTPEDVSAVLVEHTRRTAAAVLATLRRVHHRTD